MPAEEFDELDAQLPEFLTDPKGVLRRRWPWMLAVFLVTSIGATAYVSTIPQTYQASGRLLLTEQRIPEDLVRPTSEEEIPDAGIVRLRDPEAPHRLAVFDTRSARARARYAAACAARRRALERRLRADGADTLALRTDRNPLHALTRFFQVHAERHHGAAA